MKQNLKIAAFVTAFIALAITGCQKELSSLNTTPATDIQALTAQTESENNAVEVLYNDASGEMTATNEGIAFDYLVTAEDFDATANSMGANSSSTSACFSRVHASREFSASRPVFRKKPKMIMRTTATMGFRVVFFIIS